MKSLVKSSSAIVLGFLLGALSIAVQAQSTPASTPPKMEKIEEIPDSGITISKPETAKNKTVEKRVNGKVTEVQVKAGKSSYTVKANPEVGNAPKGTVQGDANRAAQWTILEFGGGKKESKEVETIPTLQPAPASTSSSASSAASTPNKK